MNDVYAAVLVERFGAVAEWVREARRRPPAREIARRRRVLAASTTHKISYEAHYGAKHKTEESK